MICSGHKGPEVAPVLSGRRGFTPIRNDLEVLVLGQRLPRPESEQSRVAAIEGDGAEGPAEFAARLAELGRRQRQGAAPVGRRRALRKTTDTPATMKILNPMSPARVEIRVLEASPHRLRLRVPQFLSPGTAVQVRLKDSVTLAEVRYCRPTGAEFYVGVWIQDVFPWNQAAVPPTKPR